VATQPRLYASATMLYLGSTAAETQQLREHTILILKLACLTEQALGYEQACDNEELAGVVLRMLTLCLVGDGQLPMPSNRRMIKCGQV
jgi:hypothetical protein